MNISRLMTEIERVAPEGGEWCTPAHAHVLAALVLSIRPALIVEIGVWQGGSLVPMLLALKEIGAGKAIAIDPWKASASTAGEDGANAAWWGKVDHEQAYQAFRERLRRHDLELFCDVVRAPSDAVDIGARLEALGVCEIDLVNVDGNHREQAVRDAARYLPYVRPGGFAILDDVTWDGGHVGRAVEHARQLGFVELYPLGSGVVMQRQGHGPR